MPARLRADWPVDSSRAQRQRSHWGSPRPCAEAALGVHPGYRITATFSVPLDARSTHICYGCAPASTAQWVAQVLQWELVQDAGPGALDRSWRNVQNSAGYGPACSQTPSKLQQSLQHCCQPLLSHPEHVHVAFGKHNRLVCARPFTPCMLCSQFLPAPAPAGDCVFDFEVVGTVSLTRNANSGHIPQYSVSHARSLIVFQLFMRSRLTMHFFAQPDTLHSAVHEQACMHVRW
jgi:hypothetical protein